MGKIRVVVSFSLLLGGSALLPDNKPSSDKMGESVGFQSLRGHRGLQDATCPGGISGIPSGDLEVCCSASCLNCGGTGCNGFPGGAGDCCIGGTRGILANAGDCATNGAAPCVLGDESATPDPSAATPPPVAGGEMCPGGVPGIPSVRGEVCCPTSCLNCGGRGCGTFPGGQGNCCIGGRNGILANSDFCSQTMAAPCRIDDDPTPAPTVEVIPAPADEVAPAPTAGSTPSPVAGGTCPGGIAGIVSRLGNVCCDISCGQCGGAACRDLPGGAGACCIGGGNGVLATRDFCGLTMEAPCRIGDGFGCTAVVIIEAEDLEVSGAWSVISDTRASGNEYIAWEGLGFQEQNDDYREGDVITTIIHIPTAGTYSFQWLMRQPSDIELIDRSNDSWLFFPDATRFGPAGTTDEYGTFVKVFGFASGLNFRYQGQAEDDDDVTSEIAVEFAEAGDYTMQIAGRSHGHQLDQIMLFGDDQEAEDAARCG